MKRGIIIILLMYLPICLADNIVISEVLFWANNTDAGGEFVELYNPTEYPVNISGWLIATESSDTDAEIPEGTLLLPHQYYLIADTGWDENKDDAGWPSADYEETISLFNSDSGVALVADDVVIDATGWGDPNSIEDNKYEGTPHPIIIKGNSIERRPGLEDETGGNGQDTDDNSADFLERSPEPQNSDSFEIPFVYDPAHVGNFTIEFTVIGSGPEFLLVEVEDDSDAEGVQVLPFPGEEREVEVNATMQYNGVEGLVVQARFMNLTHNLSLDWHNDTLGLFTGSVSLPYHASGNRSIIFTAVGRENASYQVWVGVMEVAALLLDSPGTSFESEPGQEHILWGDDDVGTADKPTLKNIGNVPLDMKVKGAEFSNGDVDLPPETCGYNLNMSQVFMPLSSSWQTLDAGLESSHTVPLSVQLRIPDDASSGAYLGSLLIAGAAS